MLDLDIIDAHHHLTDYSCRSYPWLEGSPAARYHGDDIPLRRDYLINDFRADAQGLRIVGSVHIENGAANPIAESAWVDSVTATQGLPTVQVAKADLAAADVADLLERHATLPSIRGIRDILNWHPDPYYSHRSRGDIITDPHWRAGFARLAPLGLSFDLQVFPSQLGDAADLARQFPDTQIVLDHAGMPIDRSPDALRAWKHDLTVFAAEPNTAVKISALGTNDHHWTADSIRPIVLHTIDVFGPDRTMFGSNFPVDGLYSTMIELYDAFDRITAAFTNTERAALFAGTARHFYRIPPHPTPLPHTATAGGRTR